MAHGEERRGDPFGALRRAGGDPAAGPIFPLSSPEASETDIPLWVCPSKSEGRDRRIVRRGKVRTAALALPSAARTFQFAPLRRPTYKIWRFGLCPVPPLLRRDSPFAPTVDSSTTSGKNRDTSIEMRARWQRSRYATTRARGFDARTTDREVRRRRCLVVFFVKVDGGKRPPFFVP